MTLAAGCRINVISGGLRGGKGMACTSKQIELQSVRRSWNSRLAVKLLMARRAKCDQEVQRVFPRCASAEIADVVDMKRPIGRSVDGARPTTKPVTIQYLQSPVAPSRVSQKACISGGLRWCAAVVGHCCCTLELAREFIVAQSGKQAIGRLPRQRATASNAKQRQGVPMDACVFLCIQLDAYGLSAKAPKMEPGSRTVTYCAAAQQQKATPKWPR